MSELTTPTAPPESWPSHFRICTPGARQRVCALAYRADALAFPSLSSWEQGSVFCRSSGARQRRSSISLPSNFGKSCAVKIGGKGSAEGSIRVMLICSCGINPPYCSTNGFRGAASRLRIFKGVLLITVLSLLPTPHPRPIPESRLFGIFDHIPNRSMNSSTSGSNDHGTHAAKIRRAAREFDLPFLPNTISRSGGSQRDAFRTVCNNSGRGLALWTRRTIGTLRRQLFERVGDGTGDFPSLSKHSPAPVSKAFLCAGHRADLAACARLPSARDSYGRRSRKYPFAARLSS